jgi:hypothetical protein
LWKAESVVGIEEGFYGPHSHELTVDYRRQFGNLHAAEPNGLRKNVTQVGVGSVMYSLAKIAKSS